MKSAPIKISCFALAGMLLAAPAMAFQDCGCSGGSGYVVDESGEYHNSNLGYYAANCGRGITQYEAIALWQGYCNENCSFNDSDSDDCGCGLFRRCGLHRRGGCGLVHRCRGAFHDGFGCGHCGGNAGGCGCGAFGSNHGGGCGCGAFGYPSNCGCGADSGCDTLFGARFHQGNGCGGCDQSCAGSRQLDHCGHRRFFDFGCGHEYGNGGFRLRCDGCVTGACDQPVSDVSGG